MTTPFSWPVRVYYEDTDAGGVVYYASYLRFLERARTEWLRSLGFEQNLLRHEHNILFAVSGLNIDYRLPGRFNDLLAVSVRIARQGRASLSLVQEVTRGVDEILCLASVKIACVDAASFKPRPIPPVVRRGIELDH